MWRRRLFWKGTFRHFMKCRVSPLCCNFLSEVGCCWKEKSPLTQQHELEQQLTLCMNGKKAIRSSCQNENCSKC